MDVKTSSPRTMKIHLGNEQTCPLDASDNGSRLGNDDGAAWCISLLVKMY